MEDAQAEIDEVLSRAETEAAAIRSRYAAQAQREAEDAVRRSTERANEREENLAGASLLEARKDTLSAKQSMLDRAFSIAAEKLQSLSETDYVSLLASLAAQSSYSGSELIVLSPQDAKKLGDKVVIAANAILEKEGKTAALRLSPEQRATGGGLLLSNGQIETNCTFETLLRLVRGEISGAVAKALFD